jgi:hypothetical protein
MPTPFIFFFQFSNLVQYIFFKIVSQLITFHNAHPLRRYWLFLLVFLVSKVFLFLVYVLLIHTPCLTLNWNLVSNVLNVDSQFLFRRHMKRLITVLLHILARTDQRSHFILGPSDMLLYFVYATLEFFDNFLKIFLMLLWQILQKCSTFAICMARIGSWSLQVNLNKFAQIFSFSLAYLTIR